MLAAYFRTGWRGSTKLTNFLAGRVKDLQTLQIEVEGGTLVADLRIASSRGILSQPVSHTGESEAIRAAVSEGDVVYDIGAHFGFYTVLLSSYAGRSGKVLAFEPNPELLRCLSLTLERLDNTELYDVALSDEAGEAEFFVPEDASMAGLTNWTDGAGGEVRKTLCEKVKLDDLVREKELPLPDFIKCDVEGAEIKVFSGARAVLDREDAPVILFEINAKAGKSFDLTPNDYFEFLRGLKDPNYVFYRVTAGGIEPMDSETVVYENVLAVPAAKQSKVLSRINK